MSMNNLLQLDLHSFRIEQFRFMERIFRSIGWKEGVLSSSHNNRASKPLLWNADLQTSKEEEKKKNGRRIIKERKNEGIRQLDKARAFTSVEFELLGSSHWVFSSPLYCEEIYLLYLEPPPHTHTEWRTQEFYLWERYVIFL